MAKIKVYDGVYTDASDCACEYCGATPEDTEIKSAYSSGTYICGEIECWNDYCLEWVWSGDEVEITEKDVCDGCKEDTDTSYDGMCMPCWEELNEHLEEEM